MADEIRGAVACEMVLPCRWPRAGIEPGGLKAAATEWRFPKNELKPSGFLFVGYKLLLYLLLPV